jgi:hypothetical protein
MAKVKLYTRGQMRKHRLRKQRARQKALEEMGAWREVKHIRQS